MIINPVGKICSFLYYVQHPMMLTCWRRLTPHFLVLTTCFKSNTVSPSSQRSLNSLPNYYWMRKIALFWWEITILVPLGQRQFQCLMLIMFVGLNHGTGTEIRASRPESKGIMVSIKLAKPSEVRDLTRTKDLRLLSILVLGTTIWASRPKVRDCAHEQTLYYKCGVYGHMHISSLRPTILWLKWK